MSGSPDRPAGIVTRSVAAVVDAAVVGLAEAAGYFAVAAVSYAAAPWSFRWPAPPPVFTGVLGGVFAIVYLTVSWRTLGRTYGGALLGLRVLTDGGRRLGWPRAALRALFYVVFPVGLLWVAVSPRRRSVPDVVLRTTVRYDWTTEGVSTKDPV
ncbi:RDD family protein [Amycolatopsis sp. FDAARGOS 1241]|uniref:RDD family protein n=1 Tax=Amycolatopsis sp. FDAARGOS 1241 TaxID=2778070 RepID=UPI00194E11CF|nr:RDD family protein [Amycolatopsis sp. FDAARGOS 1241]QRP43273.1 RDD family protein [Amycolatopsis sp. FDAARGOS 1241]